MTICVVDAAGNIQHNIGSMIRLVFAAEKIVEENTNNVTIQMAAGIQSRRLELALTGPPAAIALFSTR